MESSGPSGKTSEPSKHNRWSEILGTTIAVLTLTIPLFVIGYYSASSNTVESLPTNAYTIPVR